jgi:hypothetical protein
VITSGVLQRAIVGPEGCAEPTIDEAIAAFIPPSHDWAKWEKLQAACLRFLETPWLWRAVEAGWSEAELWSCFPTHKFEVMKRRGDCKGLVVALATGMGCTIQTINEREAVVTRRRTGARLVHRREVPGREYAVLWWHAPFAEAL